MEGLTAENFKHRIKQTGLKYKKVSELLGVHNSHLCHLLNGEKKFTQRNAERLNNILKFYEIAEKNVEAWQEQTKKGFRIL